MKRMLFNATQAEELRVAIVDGQKLIDVDIDSVGKEQRKGNIYKGTITRIEPGLEACFVDYGCGRHGFLPFKEISRAYFKEGVDVTKARIHEAVYEKQPLIIQVEKDERGNKGAALTTFISLAGRYLVLMPNNPRGGGVSRRIEGDERIELREAMDQLSMPSGMSLIGRTAGIGRSIEELQWDLDYLLQLWNAIETAANAEESAQLIYQEDELIIRAIRDYFQPDIGEILVDTPEVYNQAVDFMSRVMPQNVERIKRYTDDVPLFSRFQIEHQIETAYAREVTLPSGGSIVIDHAEALVAVDVNSARSTRGVDIEETALKTNLEAAEEIARQMRLRDIGGLIVIDFIDMEVSRNQREVENKLREALRFDRARVQAGKISRFGLLELSRQRLRPALGEASHSTCPRCMGTGHIRNTESTALHSMRILQEEAMKDNTGAIHLQVPVDVATFLLNEKREVIQSIEARHQVDIVVIPNIYLETPAMKVVRLRADELPTTQQQTQASYTMVETPAEDIDYRKSSTENTPAAKPEPLVKGIKQQPARQMPAQPSRTEPSIFTKIATWLSSLFTAEEEKKPTRRNYGKNDQRSRRRLDRTRNGYTRQRDRHADGTSDRRNSKQSAPVAPPAQEPVKVSPAVDARQESDIAPSENRSPRNPRRKTAQDRRMQRVQKTAEVAQTQPDAPGETSNKSQDISPLATNSVTTSSVVTTVIDSKQDSASLPKEAKPKSEPRARAERSTARRQKGALRGDAQRKENASIAENSEDKTAERPLENKNSPAEQALVAQQQETAPTQLPLIIEKKLPQVIETKKEIAVKVSEPAPKAEELLKAVGLVMVETKDATPASPSKEGATTAKPRIKRATRPQKAAAVEPLVMVETVKKDSSSEDPVS